MAKKAKFIPFILATVGLLIALAVGWALVAGSIGMAFIPLLLVQLLGWVIIIGGIFSYIRALMQIF